MIRKFRLGLFGLGLLILLSGCIGRSSPEVSYYSLLSMEHLGHQMSMTETADFALGIGPITIPDSLKRAQIATRDADNRYRFSEFHRWAGVLEKDIAMVVGDNLGAMLGVEKVAFYPWLHHFQPSHRVVLDIVRFDGTLEGEVVLSVRWAIVDAEGRDYLAGGKSVYRQAVASQAYKDLVRAESLLLMELSREMADAIKQL